MDRLALDGPFSKPREAISAAQWQSSQSGRGPWQHIADYSRPLLLHCSVLSSHGLCEVQDPFIYQPLFFDEYSYRPAASSASTSAALVGASDTSFDFYSLYPQSTRHHAGYTTRKACPCAGYG